MSAMLAATDWAEAGGSHCALRKPLAFSPMAPSSLTSAFGLQSELVKVFVFCFYSWVCGLREKPCLLGGSPALSACKSD